MATNSETNGVPMKFQSILQVDVPKGRDGKHKKIVTQLLNDIDQLTAGTALKVPLTALPDTKENIRAALSRAAAQRKSTFMSGESSRSPSLNLPQVSAHCIADLQIGCSAGVLARALQDRLKLALVRSLAVYSKINHDVCPHR